jgi:hypothetical protein
MNRSILIEISSVGYAAAAAIAAKESLTRHSKQYANEFDGDIPQAIPELRWAGFEDGWYQSEDKKFRNANDLLELAEEPSVPT